MGHYLEAKQERTPLMYPIGPVLEWIWHREVQMDPKHTGLEEMKVQKKYLWFGYGVYGGQPTLQVGGGMVRNTDMVEKLLQFLGMIKKSPDEEQEEKPE